MDRMIFLVFLFLHLAISIGSTSQLEDADDDNGGHSSEFKPMGYEWKMTELEYTPDLLDEIHTLTKRRSVLPSGAASRRSFDEEFYKFYRSLPDFLRSFQEDAERVLRKYQLAGVVTGRIKSLSSLKKKMEQDGITDFREITDIVGMRVTLQTIGDILKFKQAYLHTFNESIDEIRCYGVCGPAVGISDPRAKFYWPWKGSGYRRLHFKVAIPELETAGEVQIGTPYMTLWADWGHEVVYKGPEELKQNSGVREYAQRLAKYYMTLDDLRNGMPPKCPRILKQANAKKVFGLEEWRVLGSPPNVCQFWNDLRTNM